MLKKLLKHEFIATGRMFLPVLGLILILTPLLGFIFRISTLGEDNILSIFSGLSIAGYVLLLVSAAIASFVFIVIRFYKSMTTDEAYLTFTIPAKTSTIIASKLIPAMFWQFLAILLLIFSVGLFTFILDLWDFNDISIFIRELISTFPFLKEHSFSVSLFIVLLVLTMVISYISGTLQVYAAIALGQLMNSHRLLSAIGFYVGLYTVLQTISTIFVFPLTYFYMDKLENANALAENVIGYYNIVFILATTISIIMGIGLYIITVFCFKKKLNLE